jgi:hypothetical protein
MVMASPAEKSMTSEQSAIALKRMQEMESTLKQMHALLKQMRAKTASSTSKDPLVKANLEMWQLMLGQLDKQFDELRTTTLARQNLNARRAALYKQAAAKAAAEAEAARNSSSSPAAATGTAERATGQDAAGATAGHNETETTSTPAAPTPK